MAWETGKGRSPKARAAESNQPAACHPSPLYIWVPVLIFLENPFLRLRELGLLSLRRPLNQTQNQGGQRTPGSFPGPGAPPPLPRWGRRNVKPRPSEPPGSDVMPDRAGLSVLFPLPCSSSPIPSLPSSPFTPPSRGSAASGAAEEME